MISTKFKNAFKSLLPSGYQIKLSLATIITRSFLVILVFSSYYLLYTNLPDQFLYGKELAFLMVSVLTILFFLPLVEQISKSFRSKFLSEYLTEDAESFRQAIKRFNFDSLLKNVFPDMVKITGSQSGLMAVLTPQGTFSFHTYYRGRQKKLSPTKDIDVKESFQNFLRLNRNGSSVADTLSSPEINHDFMELHANFIQPFIFREKLFGFLAVSNIPTQEAAYTLSLLAGQSAVTIHNHILSYHISENKKYKKEAEYAVKVQNLLETGTVPELFGWDIKVFNRTTRNLIEFFQVEDGSWYFLVLNLGRSYQHIGILLSYILGVVYAQSQLRLLKGFSDIKALVHNTLQKLDWNHSVEMLIGKIGYDDLQILMDGKQFRVLSSTEEALASVGWKNTISLDKGPVRINHRNEPLMEFHFQEGATK